MLSTGKDLTIHLNLFSFVACSLPPELGMMTGIREISIMNNRYLTGGVSV